MAYWQEEYLSIIYACRDSTQGNKEGTLSSVSQQLLQVENIAD